MNRRPLRTRVRAVIVVMALALGSMGLLTACENQIGFFQSVVFVPANQSGPQVTLQGTLDLPAVKFTLPAGRPGALRFGFAGPGGGANGLDKCTFTWNQVGSVAAPLTEAGGLYQFSYDLPGGVNPGLTSATFTCTITTGTNRGKTWTAFLLFEARYDYVYWTTGDGIGRARTDGSQANPGFITGLKGVDHVAVFGDFIYFDTDKGIGRADLDGMGARPDFVRLDRTDVSSLLALINPSSGSPFLRWTLHTANGALKTQYADANLNGSIIAGGPLSLGPLNQVVFGGGGTNLVQIGSCPGCDHSDAYMMFRRKGKGSLPTPLPRDVVFAGDQMFWSTRTIVSRATATGVTDVEADFVDVGAAAHGIALDSTHLLVVMGTGPDAVLGRVGIDGGGLDRSFLPIAGATGGLDTGPGRDPAPYVSIRDQQGAKVTEVDFGNVDQAGLPYASRRLQVMNTGNAPVTVSGFALSGTDASSFVTNTTGSFECGLDPVVPPGGSCWFMVGFRPGGGGAKSATLRISGTMNPAQYVDLPVKGAFNAPPSATSPAPTTASASPTLAPVFSVSPSSHDFGIAAIGYPTSETTVTVTNAGNADLTLEPGAVTITGSNAGDFDMTGNTCDADPATLTLGPGSSCDVTVLFSPTATGTRSASIQCVDNAAGSPHSVALTGTGVNPALSASPNPATVSASSPGSQTVQVTVTNTSGSAVTIPGVGGVLLDGGTAPELTLGPETCSGQILVATVGSCTVDVVLTLDAGAAPDATFFGTLEITHDGAGSPVSVLLDGTVSPIVS